MKFLFATRPRALPVLIDLYRSAEDDRNRNRRHRTRARIMCVLLRVRARFPERAAVFAGDSGYGTHDVARFCYRHRARRTLVSKLHPDANRFDPPPPYPGKGRPRVKGDRRKKPRAAGATAFARSEVGWYGGGNRRAETLDGTGHGYKGGAGLVPVRWVFVRDTTGTHRDEYFVTTAPELTPSAVIGHSRGRWNIETTFPDARSGPRAWREGTARRAGPCRLGRCSGVAIRFHALPAPKRGGPGRGRARRPSRSPTPGPHRPVAKGFGPEPPAGADAPLDQRPEPVRERLRTTLAPAP